MPKSVTVTILFALLLFACASAEPHPTVTPAPPPTIEPTAAPTTPPEPALLPTPTEPPATPAALPLPARPVSGGTAVLGLVGRPANLNPLLTSHPALRAIVPLLFDSLLRANPQTGQLEPALAERWDYSAGGQTVTFHLPPNLAWSDGAPLTAADVAQSLQASRHPAALKFAEFSAVDEQTLKLEFLAGIDCAAVSALGLLPILPAGQELDARPVGSGPFVVQNWSEDGRTLALARNPNYHGRPPNLEGVTVRFLDDTDMQIALSEGASQFDVIGPLAQSTTPPDGFRQLTTPNPEMVYVAVNLDPKNEPSLPAAVRAALPQALDRPAILAELLNGDGQLLAGSLLPGHWAAAPELLPPEYNPQAARNQLAAAGFADTDGDGWLDDNGARLELNIRLNGSDDLQRRLGWLVSSYYRDVGLFARAQSVPRDSLLDDLFTHDFRLAIFRWPLLPEPDQRMFWHSAENEVGRGLNFTSYANPRLDSLLEAGVAVPGCSAEERRGRYTQAQQILADDRPVDFLLAPNRHLLVSNRLQGVEPGPFAPLTWNAAGWFLSTE